MAAKPVTGSTGEASGATSRIQKLTALIRRFGWKRSVTAVGLWGLRQVLGYRSAIIYRLDLSEIRLEGCQRFEWGYKNPSEITPKLWRAADIHGSEQTTPSGVRCFAGSFNDEQCYLSLVSTRGFSVPGRLSVTFASETEAYVGNCTTLDEYRGMGIYPCGLSELGSRLHSEGCRWLYLFVERENLSSIRGVEKAGFSGVAECSVFEWGRRSRKRWGILRGIRDAESIQSWRI